MQTATAPRSNAPLDTFLHLATSAAGTGWRTLRRSGATVSRWWAGMDPDRRSAISSAVLALAVVLIAMAWVGGLVATPVQEAATEAPSPTVPVSTPASTPALGYDPFAPAIPAATP